MRRLVHLHGAFAGFHDGPIEVFATTVWEAIEAVTIQLKGFAPDPVSGRKKLRVVGYDSVEKLKTFGDDALDIHVVPALVFGKDGGIVQTVVGVALVVVGMLIPPGPWQEAIISAGVGMVIGGVIQMLSPQPQLNSNNSDEARSKYLASSVNTVEIGTTIPLLYGMHRVGGHILSLNIDSTDTGL